MLVYVSPGLAEMFGHAGQDVSVYVEADNPTDQCSHSGAIGDH